MEHRRSEPRLLCAELVRVRWTTAEGSARETVAVLEDISPSGACFQAEEEIAVGTPVVIISSGGDLPGVIRHGRWTVMGYLLGVEFAPGVKWNAADFQPEHLLDPESVPGEVALGGIKSVQ